MAPSSEGEKVSKKSWEKVESESSVGGSECDACSRLSSSDFEDQIVEGNRVDQTDQVLGESDFFHTNLKNRGQQDQATKEREHEDAATHTRGRTARGGQDCLASEVLRRTTLIRLLAVGGRRTADTGQHGRDEQCAPWVG